MIWSDTWAGQCPSMGGVNHDLMSVDVHKSHFEMLP